MSNEFANLEHEVEAQLRDLGPRFDVDWPAETPEAVRAAVHLELMEDGWQTAASTPPQAALGRVRAAVREELAAQVQSTRPAWRSRTFWTGVAAAAAVALAVGLQSHRPLKSPPQIPATVPDAGYIDRFADAAEAVWAAQGANEAWAVDPEASLDTLNARTDQGGRVEQMIEDLHQQLDNLFMGPTEEDQLSTALQELAPA